MPLRTTAFRDFSILRSLTNWPVPAGRSTANGGIQRWPFANDRGCTLRVPVTEGWVMSGGYSGLAWSAVATLSHKHHCASGSLRSSCCCSMHAVHAVLTQVQPYLLYWDAYGSLIYRAYTVEGKALLMSFQNSFFFLLLSLVLSMLVTKQLTVPIDFHSIFFHAMEVNGNRKLCVY